MNLSAPQPVTECSPVMSPDFSFVSGPETSWPPSGNQADLLAFHVDEPLNNSTHVSLTTVPCWKILLNCWCFSPPFCVTVYKAYLTRRRWIWEAFPPLFVFFGKWTDKYVNTRPWIYGLWFCALNMQIPFATPASRTAPMLSCVSSLVFRRLRRDLFLVFKTLTRS